MVFVFSFSELQKEKGAGLEVRLSKPFREIFCQPDCWDGGDCGRVGLWDSGIVGWWDCWDGGNGGTVGRRGMVGMVGEVNTDLR